MYGLTSIEMEQMRSVFASHKEVKQVWLYGSRARGNHQCYSDIDFMLVGKDIDLTCMAQIDEQLDDLFLPYRFDICAQHRLKNSALLASINREGRMFYAR